MQTLVAWIVGALVVVLGLLGLFLSGNATDAIMYWTGLLIFGFAVLFVFQLIGSVSGRPRDSAPGEGAGRAGHDEKVNPLAAETGVGAPEPVDPLVKPGKIVDRPLDEGPRAVV